MRDRSAQRVDSAMAAVSSGAENTRGGPGGGLMGGGASSEAGWRLVRVWGSARGESEWYVKGGVCGGGGYASLPVRDKGGPGCAR